LKTECFPVCGKKIPVIYIFILLKSNVFFFAFANVPFGQAYGYSSLSISKRFCEGYSMIQVNQWTNPKM